MKPIYKTQLLTARAGGEFFERLTAAIDVYQANGWSVEIQYSYSGGMHSALLIVRNN